MPAETILAGRILHRTRSRARAPLQRTPRAQSPPGIRKRRLYFTRALHRNCRL